jgi:hypothetical protein
MKMPKDVRAEIEDAYVTAAHTHRCKLPSQRQTTGHTDWWWQQEENRTFYVGCCKQNRKATIYAVEAARHLCAGTYSSAKPFELLKLALAEIENSHE